MERVFLDLLKCSRCPAQEPLRVGERTANGADVIDAELRCSGCDGTYEIRGGVARFVAPEENYCENFGFQWQRWKDAQIDRLGGHHISESRFFNEVPWDREWMKGKLILDAGCGAGRFTDVAASYGARVVACDISNAIDACREVTRTHEGLVAHVQASIYNLPFRPGTFDAVYCFGVIQHTPDPTRTMQTLPTFLKPGGRIAYDFYERTPWEKPFIPRWALRRFTPSLTGRANLRLAQALTAAFFPMSAVLARLPLVKALAAALPIAIVHHPELSLRQEYIWTLLDTFDWYGPKYEIRQQHEAVAELLRSLQLQDVRARHGVVTAHASEIASA